MNELSNFNEQRNELSAQTQVAESKAVAQIQACMLMAAKFPRNENQSYIDILESCKRTSLAEQSTYAFPMGGKMVTGASIRLAEVLAQKFGNIHIDITIVNQTDDKTEAVASAMDLQTRYMVSQAFTVPHKRTTKQGVKRLTDEREIRLAVQSIGSRMLRTCILRIIPGDITEAALSQCKKTLESDETPIKEQIRNMVKAFDEMGVKVEHLEKRLGHNLNATIAAEIVTLKSIYKSLKDGMAKREDFFDIKSAQNEEAKETIQSLIKAKKETIDTETGEVCEEAKEFFEGDLS
jgi:hypothetical protein